MTLTFDNDTIRLMNLFENITGAPVKDCLIDNENGIVYFVIQEDKVGVAIGKNGAAVKKAERMIGKSIKLFEFSKDVTDFVKKLVPQATSIKIKSEDDKTVIEIKVDKKDKAMVIGRDARNLKLFKELLQRSHNVNDLIVR
ncbi:MAG: NusA-like transcription termination signal-binding factor [Candidatus Aenigmarchaeota archaeon]|nr:NusA-like transcription termination signal-binding factor [Candidatus Aenigmarchaeota archaeon]